MGNVKNFAERSREFEQAHYSCKELLEDRISNIESFVSKWILAAIGGILLVQVAGFTYCYYEFLHIRKKIDYRYFLMKESLEDIHKVKLEQGKVVRDFTKE